MSNIDEVKSEDCLEYLVYLKEDQGREAYLIARQFLYNKYKIPDLMTDPYVRI